MADATFTRSRSPLYVKSSVKPFYGLPAPIPLVAPFEALEAPAGPGAAALSINPISGNAVKAAKRKQWAGLQQRQEWADEGFMRGHLRVAGLRIASNTEPATVARMKTLLRRVGVHSPEVQASVGMPLAKFLESNARLPLWAALALVLESTGRFTPIGCAGAA